MSGTSDSGTKKEPWETPALRNVQLTEEEIAKLRASDDPMALLLRMKPELQSKGQPGK